MLCISFTRSLNVLIRLHARQTIGLMLLYRVQLSFPPNEVGVEKSFEKTVRLETG